MDSVLQNLLRSWIFAVFLPSAAIAQPVPYPGDERRAQTVSRATTTSNTPASPLPDSLGHFRYELSRLSWTNQDFKDYSEFVRQVGHDTAVCSNVDRCLKESNKPAVAAVRNGLTKNNPSLAKQLTDQVVFYSDCADWGKYLEGVFAVSRGLPFAYRKSVVSLQPDRELKGANGEVLDQRYTKHGNKIVAMETVNPENIDRYFLPQIDKDGKPTGKFVFLGRMNDDFSTHSLRTNPNDAAEQASDFYSPKISAIKPGTVLYDPAGHVGVVYDVTPEGKILISDSHPDNSLTHKEYDETWAASRVETGFGFRNLRPGIVEVSGVDGEGRRILRTTFRANSELPTFSLEQYQKDANGMHTWTDGDGRPHKVTWVDQTRLELTNGQASLDPIKEFRGKIVAVCKAAFDRVNAVDSAFKKNLHLTPHPDKIPRNLPLGGGEVWAQEATAGRDSRFKLQIHFASEVLDKAFLYKTSGLRQFGFHGTRHDLAVELLKVLKDEDEACANGRYSVGKPLGYTKSDGTFQKLSLKDLFGRAFRMSFDPYHCPELRWGASRPGELLTCANNPLKDEWHRAQQPLRNAMLRNNVLDGDYTLAELRAELLDGQLERVGAGLARAPSIDPYEKLSRELDGGSGGTASPAVSSVH